MIRTKGITLMLAATALSACVSTTPMAGRLVTDGEVTRQGKMAAEYHLKDPGSVRYRGTATYRLANGDYVFCGEQNARNSFGGYVGFTPVLVRFRPGQGGPVRLTETREYLAAQGCAALAAGRPIPVRAG